MKTGFMQKVDYYVGQPLCISATIIYKLKCLFRKKPAFSNPKKIVLIKLLGLGSVILTKPAIEKIRQQYPGSELFFITFKQNTEIVDLLGLVPPKNTLTIRSGSLILFTIDIYRSLRKLWKEKIDLVIDFEFFSRFSALLGLLIRSPYRAGFYNHYNKELDRGDFLTHKVFFNEQEHAAASYLGLVKSLHKQSKKQIFIKEKINIDDIALPKITPGTQERDDLFLDLKEKHKGISQNSKIFIMNPNAGEINQNLRQWPVKHFLNLSNFILSEIPEAFIVLIGSKKEQKFIETIKNQIENKRRIILFKAKSLKQLAALFSVGTIFITNDTGPMHLASLTPIKIIALFGPGSPLLFAPISKNTTNLFVDLVCQPCQTISSGKKTKCTDNVCMQMIKPEAVMRLIKNELENNQPFPLNIKTPEFKNYST